MKTPPENSYTILYFGLLADRAGCGEEAVQSRATTARALFEERTQTRPLGIEIDQLRAAVNDEFTTWDHPLQSGDTVAFLAPMSGG